MVETPGDRLKSLRMKRFETAQLAADAYGWNSVTYRSHESGMRNIPIPAARKYAAAFGSTVGHILGIGAAGANSEAVNPINLVPLVAKASAGAFRYDEGLETEGVQVPAVPRADVPAGVQYAVLVDGPSVNLKIPDGAFAICAPFDKYPGGPKHGQLVHVVRERAGLHEHTIKEIQYTKAGTVLMPRSSDPRHQEPIDMSASEDDTTVRICGVVIGSFQPL
jgi:phage repressor protein C with HTH and peptisase S24 domain